MKIWNTSKSKTKFEIFGSSRDLQVAMMSLTPGSKSDDAVANEHPKAEQWLYVIAGSGTARIGRSAKKIRKITLKKGSLLLIEKNELHQIENTGKKY